MLFVRLLVRLGMFAHPCISTEVPFLIRYFVPGGVSPVVLTDLPGVQSVSFAFGGPDANRDLTRLGAFYSFSLGGFPCNVTFGPYDPSQRNQTARCFVRDVIGKMQMTLSLNGTAIARSQEWVRTPAPTIKPSSLRLIENRNGTTDLQLTSPSQTIYFDGTGFAYTSELRAQVQSVWYGTSANREM